MGDSDRNKEEQYSNILSDFVACTGIQDEGQAIRYLENVNWDLLAAINLVMPQHSQRLPSEAASSSGDVEMITISSDIPGTSPVTTYTNPNASIITIAPEDEDEDMPSSSSSNHRKPKTIQFKILYNKSTISIPMSESKTVYDLKLEVFSRTGLQICKQFFKGWPHNEFIFNDKVTLSSLKLPTVTDLILDSKASPMPQNGHSSSSYNNMKKAAINLVMPQHSQRLPSEAASSSGDVEMITISSDIPGTSPVTTYTNPNASIITIAPEDEDEDMPSSSSSNHRKPKTIQFKILYNKSTISIPMSESKTVYDLKLEVFSRTGLQICKQFFKGWPHNEFIFNDKVTLSSLKLPTVTDLILDSKASPMPQNGHSSSSYNNMKKKKCDASDASKLYKLNIADLTNGREYHLKYGGNTKVSAVKEDVAALSKIPISQQVWTGWSDQEESGGDSEDEEVVEVKTRGRARSKEERDSMSLYKTGIGYPNHDLTVEGVVESNPAVSNPASNKVIDVPDTDSSMDEYEDAACFTEEEEDTVSEVLSTRRTLQSLIPDNIEDETTGTIHLIEQFESRYGDQRPHFYPGTLDDAIREACFKPAAQLYSSGLQIAARRLHVAREAQEVFGEQQRTEIREEEERNQREMIKIEQNGFLICSPGGGEGGVGSANSSAGGATKCRRFYATQPVQDLINYLIVEGYDAEDYKVIFGWPRKELSPDISHQTLAELKFCPQETLIVEERW
ncbi:FAS-associated factor 1 [Diaphorina citri]|uniref:FAS-associated factor 1 n=2 Tax=Diaphorina citri TaxID=121845 RepID=A0A3Q0IVN1_DIACI|nr:FAS-associated factor 1 [Diaphorina citri]